MLDRIADGDAVEGMEALAPVLVDDLRLVLHELPAGTPRPGLRPRADPHPGRRPGPHVRGVPAGVLGGGRRRRHGADRPRRGRAAHGRAGPRRTRPALGIPWWTLTPVRRRRLRSARRTRWRSTRRRPRSIAATPSRAAADLRRVDPRRLAGRAGLRRTRPGAARGRAARRGRGAGPRGALGDSRAGAGLRHRHHRPARRRLRRARAASWRCSARPTSPASAARRPRTCSGCRPGAGATPSTRSRCKPGDHVVHEQHGVGRLRRDGAAHRQRRRARVPDHRVRPRARGQPGDRLFVPTDSLDQLTRYVGGEAPTLNRLGGADWAEDEGPRPQGGQGDRRRADPALQRADGDQGPRVRPGHAVAARARGRLPVHRDAGPARRDRRGQGRHGEDRPDGPGDLRRRRLRQDRDRGAGGVQGGAGRQAGGRAGADHAAGPAALRHVLRADGAVPGHRAVAVPVRQPAGDARRRWPACSTARSTSSSAPTGCCSRPPGSRTSAW